MLADYRTWLESELKLLGNASHHAYSFGQANMAKRAIERLDQELSGRVRCSRRVKKSTAAVAVLAEMHAAGPGCPQPWSGCAELLDGALNQEAGSGAVRPQGKKLAAGAARWYDAPVAGPGGRLSRGAPNLEPSRDHPA